MIRYFDTFVNGKVVEQEKKSRLEYENAIRDFLKTKDRNEILLLIESAGLMEKLDDFETVNSELIEYEDSLINMTHSFVLRGIDVKSIKTILDDKYAENDKVLNELKLVMNNEEQKVLNEEIKNLESEKYMVSIHPKIEKNINALKEIHLLKQAQKKTTTNKITVMSKELAEELITTEYISRFDSELKELSRNGIKVELTQQRAGKGKIPYKVVLNDALGKSISLQDILSEGENRVTALAAFFAESSGRNENIPLIVDDPISSLDYVYENKVIERLVRAAKNRLEKLSKITINECKMFDRLMTRYSYYDHSMSDETPLIEQSIDELEADLNELRDWIKTY